ncbi:hypothetical protein Bca52824_010990 [Brassica carinata]|uniref:Uncharacterized protein n=1 Tax=Brassica carinata TaxID=52824 RepID=A0A8X7WFF4_BRACI|nr:hypothetical protein Bca52824_010990 [Brassica carinata]
MGKTERSHRFSRDGTEEFNEAWMHGRVITGMVQKTCIFGFLCPEGNARAKDGHQLTLEHRERFTPATQADPNPYSKAEMDDKLNDIYTIQYDSMNDFKWKLDSVYHPLNDKIKYLTQTMENLA